MTALDVGLMLALGLSLACNVRQAATAARLQRMRQEAFAELRAYALKTAEEQWNKCRDHTLQLAKDVYRRFHPGLCRMLSQGYGCRCFLCRMDEFRAAAREEGPEETRDSEGEE